MPRHKYLLAASSPRCTSLARRSWHSSSRLNPCTLPSVLSHSRHSSIQAQQSALARLPDLDSSKLTVTDTLTPKKLLPPDKLVFGRSFTDHMLSIEWTAENGWLPAQIIPYQNLSLDPATCVFHYGFECFEGMKAYKDKNGDIRLFRPDMNVARFNSSSARIALPTFDNTQLIELIKRFVQKEERFIPTARGYSLYLRPTMIGTQRTLGVGPPGSALLYVIASPVGPYYPTGFKAVSLQATSHVVRAWPGGVGDKKLGANYAPCIVPQLEAAKSGFQQNLWLYGPDSLVTEAGTMNFFCVIRDPDTGKKVIYTAPLDGMILKGVTRDSIINLARTRLLPKGNWDIKEEYLSMGQLAKAQEEGRLLEAFGAGTAATISPVRLINWNGTDIPCGLSADQEAGPVAQQMKDWIEGIQYGDEPDHPWSWKL